MSRTDITDLTKCAYNNLGSLLGYEKAADVVKSQHSKLCWAARELLHTAQGIEDEFESGELSKAGLTESEMFELRLRIKRIKKEMTPIVEAFFGKEEVA